MEKTYTFEGKVIEVDLFGTKYSVKLVKETYPGGNVAIQGIIVGGDEDGEDFATLSVNMPNMKGLLKEDEIFIKSYSENEGFAEAARVSGFFTDTAQRTPSGFVLLEIWRMVPVPVQTKKYTVRFMTVYQEWTGIDAPDPKEAISKCNVPPEFDLNDFSIWNVSEEVLYQYDSEGYAFCPTEEALLQFLEDNGWENVSEFITETGLSQECFINNWFLTIGGNEGTRVFFKP
jgi:hypothetical protein